MLGPLLFVTALAASGPCESVLQTTGGSIQGIVDGESCVVRGIPYAAPPVDALRWRPPQPAAPWEGVRDGAEWGGRCEQPNKLFFRWANQDPSKTIGEDCLYLNVWRPLEPAQEARPVLVFIHGGGLGVGTANSPVYHGAHLAADQDVVVVSFNYRLGLMGWMALPDLAGEDPDGSTGNYGLLDQLAALRWVQDNADSFGGDPDKVVVFGQSGGGWSVCSLLASPLAAGLFDGAVMMSGGCDHASPLDEDYPRGEAVAEALGCASDDLECLRAVPARRLRRLTPIPTFTTFTYGPTIDGHVLHQTPLEHIRAGDYNHVPFIAGSTRDEIAMMLPREEKQAARTPPEHFAEGVQALLGATEEEAAQLTALYPLAAFDGHPADAYARMVSDMALSCPTHAGLVAAADHQDEVWAYRMEFDDHKKRDDFGAFHGGDLPLTFGTVDSIPFKLFFTPVQRESSAGITAQIGSFLGSFARTGAPGADWPPFESPQGSSVLRLASPTWLGPDPLRERCVFWNAHPNELAW